MNTNNRVMKAWGGVETRCWGQGWGKGSTSIIFSTVKNCFKSSQEVMGDSIAFEDPCFAKAKIV